MRVYRHKDKTEVTWQDFLSRANGSLSISLSCLQNVLEHFPEMLEMTENSFLAMVRQSKPMYTVSLKDKGQQGIIVKNGKIGFVISFKTGKIMSIFHFKKKIAKNAVLNPKSSKHKKKMPYKRSASKIHARHEIMSEN